MTVLGYSVLPSVAIGNVPVWRQVLRGFSQCAFQANELTGMLFVAAVAFFSWRMAVFYVISVAIGTVVARFLRAPGDLLDLGLFGFNSGLMGLALGTFYEITTVLWIWVAILAAVTAALAVAMARWLPIPFLAAPFIVAFWLDWAIADWTGLTKVDLGAFPNADVTWAHAIVDALGSSLFAPKIIAGTLFLVGIAISNWRHAAVAGLGAFIGVALAEQAGVPGVAINSGFIGFNAVLAALAAYIIIAPDLKLVVLASVLATWFFTYIDESLGTHSLLSAPALASGFVIAIWVIMFLNWLTPRFAARTPNAPPERRDVGS